MTTEYDIAIVGAGLVGSSLAAVLQQRGFRIALLEKNLPSAKPTKVDKRPISLSYGSHVILKAIGIWDSIACFASPIKKVHVSDQGAMGAVHFNATEMEVEALGYVVPFGELQKALFHAATASDTVDLICAQHIDSISVNKNNCCISAHIDDKETTLNARLLIGCDGTRSHIRHLAHIETDEKDNGEVALSALITLADSHQHTAYERFTDKGAIALLPLANETSMRVVWTMPNEQLDAIKQWGSSELILYLTDCFIGRIPKITTASQEGNYPLKTVLAKEQIKPGIALLGNSAHTLYPLAAQGFNLGLRDVAAFCEVIVNAHKANDQLGSLDTLEKYMQWRQQDQRRITRLTQGLAKTFSVHMPFAQHARGLGLLAMDLIPPLKKRLAKRAMGIAGKLPRLARGLTL